MSTSFAKPIEFGLPRVEDASTLAMLAAESITGAWSQSGFESELCKPSCRAQVARSGDEIVAYVIGVRVLDELQLMSIAVGSDFRRGGIGLNLLRRYLAALKEEGVCKVTLEVEEKNLPAQQLYARLGFVVQGERRGYYAGGSSALLMGSTLS